MNRPDRSTVDGRAFLDLQRKAKADGRPTQELLTHYALEGFLDRLVRSGHAKDLVLKGGVLLAAYDVRRPTRDVDVAARAHSNEPDDVLALVVKIASFPVDDGLAFDTATASAEPIRDEDEYAGVRVSLGFGLATGRDRFHVDVNFGDPISPAPEPIVLPRLLGGDIRLMGYPLHMVLAEKIVTALSGGTASTRWRDFGDVYVLTRWHEVDGNDLETALRVVAEHRGERLGPLSTVLAGYAALAQTKYAAWARKQRLLDRLPEDFAAVIHAVTTFADPPLTGGAGGATWAPATCEWVPSR